jgi:hypothetical protein
MGCSFCVNDVVVVVTVDFLFYCEAPSLLALRNSGVKPAIGI